MVNLPLAEKTDISNWDFENLTLKNPDSTKPDTDLLPPGAKNAVILKDGEILHRELEEGLTIGECDIAVKESNKLINLNINNKNSSLQVNVAKNTKPEAIYIVYIAESRSLVHQTEITIETGAEAEIIETFTGSNKLSSNIVSKINIKPNAKLHISAINELNGKSTLYYHRLSEIENDGLLHTTNFIINNSNIVFEDFNHLTGKGSTADVATVALATESQKQNITIRVENMAPYSIGNIVNYGVVKDTAHLAFNGIGKIHKNNHGGDNQQESRLLNLSKTAEAIANPFLLIDEGDITAGHAASIGQIDPEKIYYLMSRGMSKKEAEKMIVAGFLRPFIDIIKNEILHNRLLDIIDGKL